MFHTLNVRNSLFSIAAAVMLVGVSAQGAVAGSGANDPSLHTTGATEIADKDNVKIIQGRVGRIFIAGENSTVEAENLAENRTHLSKGM